MLAVKPGASPVGDMQRDCSGHACMRQYGREAERVDDGQDDSGYACIAGKSRSG